MTSPSRAAEPGHALGAHEVASAAATMVLHRWGPDDVRVVLVHGIGVSHRYFRRLATALTDRPDALGVLAPDLAGFGDSPRPGRPLSVADHARALGRALDRSGAVTAPVVLVGHSMGAQVVTELALQRPGLVAGVVLIGAVVDPAAPGAWRQGVRLLRDLRHEPLAVNLRMLGDWLRCGPRWYASTVPTMVEHRLDERLADVDVAVPVLLVRGEHDPVTPRSFVRHLAAVRPGAQVAEVPGAGHVAMARPALVAGWCRDLLGGATT